MLLLTTSLLPYMLGELACSSQYNDICPILFVQHLQRYNGCRVWLSTTAAQIADLLNQDTLPAVPYLLPLSAKPYQGKSDAKGQPLFKPRVTTLQPVAWHGRHHLQADLYAAVTDYVCAGYNQALQEKRNYVGFLMVLMQRLVTSSTTAIRTTLERRLAVLTASGVPPTNSPAFGEDWKELDGQEQADTFVALPTAALHNEIAEVELLLDLAQRCEATAPDAKAEALLEVLEAKLALIRTEFGVDKTGDVLDSAQAGALFDGLYLATLLDPTAIEDKVASVIHQIKEQTVAAYATAVSQGKALYDELSRSHDRQMQQELAKGDYAFAARRRAIERIGLPAVQNYRLTHLAQEETAWRKEMAQRAQARPELQSLLILYVEGTGV